MALKPPPLAVVVYLFNAQQNIQQPALGFDIPRGLHKLGLVPLRKDILLPLHDAVPHEEDLPHLRDIAHVNVASDPARPPRRGRKRLPLLNNGRNKEMLRDGQEVPYLQRGFVVG